MKRPQDPRLDRDVRALIVETRELAAAVADDTPAVFLALTAAALAIFRAYIDVDLTPDLVANIGALISMSIAAGDYWIDRLGYDPYAEHRARRIDVLQRIEASISPQIAAYRSHSPVHVPEARTRRGGVLVPESPPMPLTETDYKWGVAGRIRRSRLAKGLSQEALAQQIGKSRPHINEWENARSTPQWRNLDLLGEALDVSPYWLRTGHPEPADDET